MSVERRRDSLNSLAREEGQRQKDDRQNRKRLHVLRRRERHRIECIRNQAFADGAEEIERGNDRIDVIQRIAEVDFRLLRNEA